MPRPVIAEPVAVAVTTAELEVMDETTGLVTDSAVDEPPPLSAGESSSPQATASSPSVNKQNNLDRYFIMIC